MTEGSYVEGIRTSRTKIAPKPCPAGFHNSLSLAVAGTCGPQYHNRYTFVDRHEC
ncbi:hypothetical protein QUA56_11570 [Microcoleus sp. N3A4]|uniref:hypothetical protein n=1 Tax=Microcoleus sp. N3A4 TaxID=3055379 RepID=UPI002FD19D0A